MIGTKLAHYEITSHLGSGGMGDVYQATDSKLGRSVAVKFLPEAFAVDSDRVSRFEREARMLAALNHPNIAAIHGIEEASGRKFLVMELVDGDTLAERIQRGPLPISDALPIAKQIAEALEAAHQSGVIHRDLKPANIKVTPDGRVKVLDFGLATAEPQHAAANPNLSHSPTLLTAASMPGMILGTAAYMSPEQAKGRSVDKRTDIFAFGCVLYEMLTGKRAFDGEDVSEILAHVLTHEPDWTCLPAATPLRVAELLRLCLEKNVKNRCSDATDVRLLLDLAQKKPATESSPSTTKTGSSARLAWAFAAVMTLALAALVAARWREKSPIAPEMRVDIVTPSTTGASSQFALSPDGQSIVFVASGDGTSRLWLRRLNQTQARALAGTEGAQNPFWSGDGKSVAFFSGGSIKSVDVSGGAVGVLVQKGALLNVGADWNADGVVLFGGTENGALGRVNGPGGKPEQINVIGANFAGSIRQPHFLSDRRRFLFYLEGAPDVQGIYLASINGDPAKRLTAADSAAAWLPPDQILYVQQGRLLARQLDLKKQELVGDPILVAENVGANTLRRGAFSVSMSGVVAYRSGGTDSTTQLTWIDRSGKPAGTPLAPDSDALAAPRISPDGKRIAVDRTINGNRDVWLIEVLRGVGTRLTTDASIDGFPVWSADGSKVAFESNRNGNYDIFIKAANGVGQEEPLLELPGSQWPYEFSHDGKYLLYYDQSNNAGDLMALPLEDRERKPIAVAVTPFNESYGAFSPDGHWVSYRTDDSGRSEIVVQAFPNPGAKVQVSTNGGARPKWSPDGKELYFVADGNLMAAKIRVAGPALEPAPPEKLFPIRFDTRAAALGQQGYDVSRDGRFLVNVPLESSVNTPITLILNWRPNR